METEEEEVPDRRKEDFVEAKVAQMVHEKVPVKPTENIFLGNGESFDINNPARTVENLSYAPK